MVDNESINEFIARFAKKISYIYKNSYIDEDDYIQTGHLKLAEIRHSEYVKNDFFAYAIVSIARAMRCAALGATCAVSAPHRIKLLVHRIDRLNAVGSTEQEICNELNITVNELSDLKPLLCHKSWQELFNEPFTCSNQFSFFDDLVEVDSLTSDDIDFLRSQLNDTTKNLGLSRNQMYKRARKLRPKLTRSGYGI